MPPPAIARLKPLGQWSRPPSGLTLGVRPNSPQHRTTVRSSSCRRDRSRSKAANAGSSTWARALWISWLLTWASQPLERDLDAAHADLDQPARGQAAAAERAYRRTRRATLAGSCETSNALSCSEDIITRARASVSRCRVVSTRPRRPRAKARSTTSRSCTRASSRGDRHRRGHVGQFPRRVADLERVELAAQEPAPARPSARSGSRCAGGYRSGRRAARGSRSRRSRDARPSGRAGSPSSSSTCRARGPPPCSPSTGSTRPSPSDRRAARSPRRAGCP